MAEKSYLDPKTKTVPEEATDEMILVAAQEYPDLFGVLVERYQRPFLRLAARILNSKEEAEDAVQESFLKIYRFAGQLRTEENSKFKSWAYKIVFNTALTHYRKVKRRFGQEEYLDTFLYDVLGSGDAEDEITSRLFVKEVLEKMPADLKEVLELHYLKALSYSEIASQKNMTVPALKMKLFRAREIFRKISEGKDIMYVKKV